MSSTFDDPFPGTLATTSGKKVVATKEQKEWLCRNWHRYSGKTLREMTGATHYTLYRLGRLLHLHKSGAEGRKILERDYPELRTKISHALSGRPVSESTREGYRRYVADCRAGRRVHPVTKLAREGGEKWRDRNRRIGKHISERYKMERFRLMSGLKQNTKLRCCVTRFTASQRCHRQSALSRGYWYYEDCSEQSGERYNIYYDADTHRTALFEKNLRKDGFNVLDGTNL